MNRKMKTAIFAAVGLSAAIGTVYMTLPFFNGFFSNPGIPVLVSSAEISIGSQPAAGSITYRVLEMDQAPAQGAVLIPGRDPREALMSAAELQRAGGIDIDEEALDRALANYRVAFAQQYAARDIATGDVIRTGDLKKTTAEIAIFYSMTAARDISPGEQLTQNDVLLQQFEASANGTTGAYLVSAADRLNLDALLSRLVATGSIVNGEIISIGALKAKDDKALSEAVSTVEQRLEKEKSVVEEQKNTLFAENQQLADRIRTLEDSLAAARKDLEAQTRAIEEEKAQAARLAAEQEAAKAAEEAVDPYAGLPGKPSVMPLDITRASMAEILITEARSMDVWRLIEIPQRNLVRMERAMTGIRIDRSPSEDDVLIYERDSIAIQTGPRDEKKAIYIPTEDMEKIRSILSLTEVRLAPTGMDPKKMVGVTFCSGPEVCFARAASVGMPVIDAEGNVVLDANNNPVMQGGDKGSGVVGSDPLGNRQEMQAPIAGGSSGTAPGVPVGLESQLAGGISGYPGAGPANGPRPGVTGTPVSGGVTSAINAIGGMVGQIPGGQIPGNQSFGGNGGPWTMQPGDPNQPGARVCDIKVVTNADGSRIFFDREHPDYQSIALDPAQGVQLVCSPEEAAAKGAVPAPR